MSELIPTFRPTPGRGRQRYMSVEPSSLVSLLIDAMGRFGPRIPMSDEANSAVEDAIIAVSSGEAPEHLHLFVWDGFDSIDWSKIHDPGRRGLSLSVLRFVHLLAIGMSGLPSLGFEGLDEPEPIPYGRVISMILLAEPKMAKMVKIRDGKKGRSIVTTTKTFEMEYGDFFRIDVERINKLPPDEIFDLAIPYGTYG